MVVLPLSKKPGDFNVDPHAPAGATSTSNHTSMNWLRVSSAGTLITGGVLLITGRHRLGLAAAAAGTSLALIDQQDVVKKWWSLLPGYITQVQNVLNQVEEAIEQLAEQREKIGNVLGR